ncbi:hypothetical protein [Vibrio panuliri]|uniref:Single-stranded DNA-binding protein BPT7 domain-containing protein n=1 Tax=Vibrio panuliri TaxID=1381081 RepID=A0ABX3FG97_9VIBR|nr:hypothetical protein [Vibrio panuliri]KAB1460876.1 hypothetical protein F7O85_00430 [Vibrio panuliri]OLQ91681.1 hypothetical protein BIY20_09770 [Vibrio panuliri]
METEPNEDNLISKKNYKTYTTPTCTLKYPWLNEADTKFNAEGVYHTQFILSAEEAEPLIKLVEDAQADKVEEVQAEKGKKPRLEELPFERNEDGTVTFRCKQKATGKSRLTGKPIEFKVALFDAHGCAIAEPPIIRGGTKACIALEVVPYFVQKAGVTLRPRAVQIIELSQGGGDADSFGFGKQDGFTQEVPASKPMNKEDDDEEFNEW